jgi:hypothetical protein
MQFKKLSKLLFFAGALMVVAVGIALLTVQPAKAQCGSQASSCKNCHETQAQKPVNTDGTSWHQAHAFGDFCYICHGGNNQTTDKTAAHTGMANPLADVKTSCQQCHAADLGARAKVYADILGVQASSGSTAPTPAATEIAPVSAATTPDVISNQSSNEIVVNDPNAVNYAQNYDEIVLGKKPVNWGNMILLGMIGLIAVGGGGFVITREKLVNVSFGDTRKVEGEYSADVVDMLPQIAGLKTKTRKSLKNVLDNPKKADKVLDLMDAVVSEKPEEE